MINNKFLIIIFLLILFLFGTLFLIRFGIGGDEDTWIKDGNTWIKHGNPSTPMPK